MTRLSELRVSPAQIRFLSKIKDAGGYLICRHADMRSHGPLLRRGYIALAYCNGPDGDRDGYVFTPAGSARLRALESQERSDG